MNPPAFGQRKPKTFTNDTMKPVRLHADYRKEDAASVRPRRGVLARLSAWFSSAALALLTAGAAIACLHGTPPHLAAMLGSALSL